MLQRSAILLSLLADGAKEAVRGGRVGIDSLQEDGLEGER